MLGLSHYEEMAMTFTYLLGPGAHMCPPKGGAFVASQGYPEGAPKVCPVRSLLSFCNASGVVADGPKAIDGQTAPQSGQHAQGSHGNSVPVVVDVPM